MLNRNDTAKSVNNYCLLLEKVSRTTHFQLICCELSGIFSALTLLAAESLGLLVIHGELSHSCIHSFSSIEKHIQVKRK